MTTYLQTSPYLPRQKSFPNEINKLSIASDKAYVEISQRVNERIIGVFGTNFQMITGESWFLTGEPRRRQTLRQVYEFGSIAAGTCLSPPILHGITNIVQFTRIYGTVITDFPDYRPIPYASTSPTSNIALRVTPTEISICADVLSPNIVSGLVVLEWLSDIDTNT